MNHTLFKARFGLFEDWLRELDEPTPEQLMGLRTARDQLNQLLDREYVRNAA